MYSLNYFSNHLSKNNLIILCSSAILLLTYLVFPIQVSTMDSFYYGYSLRWGKELFSPHHLLYNFFYYHIHQSAFEKFDALAFAKILNASFAFFCLLLQATILKILDVKTLKIIALTFLTGGSFGVMRFATENEVYILPIFFSLLGSLFFVKYYKENHRTSIVFAGLFTAIACLFHQMHFMWWLGMGIGLFTFGHNFKKSCFNLILYIIPAILVPLVYISILIYNNEDLSIKSLLHFVFENYYGSSINHSYATKTILLSGISFIRTFFQVHGYMGILLQKWPYVIVSILLLLSIVLAFIKIIKNSIKILSSPISNTFVIIFFLHMLFAIYAQGNAEFMAMLPFLTSIYFGSIIIQEKPFLLITICMYLWNIILGIVPLHLYDFTGSEKWAIKLFKHKSQFYVLKDITIAAAYTYYNGTTPNNILYIKNGDSDESIEDFKNELQYKVKTNQVFTDCGPQPELFNREAVSTKHTYEKLLASYNLVAIDSIKVFQGYKKMYKIQNPN